MNKEAQFIKEHGLNKAKECLEFGKNYTDPELVAQYADLKRLVASHELVEKYKNRHGGIRFRIRWGQFRHGDTQEYNNRLKQAILDVEGCQ